MIRKHVNAARSRVLFVEDDGANGPVTIAISAEVLATAIITREDAAALGAALSALYGTGWTSDKLALTPETLNAIQAEASRTRLLHGEHHGEARTSYPADLSLVLAAEGVAAALAGSDRGKLYEKAIELAAMTASLVQAVKAPGGPS